MSLYRYLPFVAALTVSSQAATVTTPSSKDPVGKGPSVTEATTKTTEADAWENLGRLYLNKESKGLQEFWLLGRYHGHWHHADGPDGDRNDYESRRIRFGFQATMFDKLTLHAQAISGSDFEPEYNGFTELWARWTFSKQFALTVGQQKNRFTHDRDISSRYMNYLERSLLTNNAGLDYTPAVLASGIVNGWDYLTGVFSNATGTNMGDAFTDFNSGWSAMLTLKRDLGACLGAESTNLNVGFLHSDFNENATNMNRFENMFNVALIQTSGSFSLQTEALLGLDGTKGTAYGITFSPGYYVTDKLQIVARYQIAAAEQSDGLASQRRYERPVGLPAGDLYQAVTLGANYYIAKHRLKLLTGVEYAKMNDDDAVTAYAGFRFFFGPHSSAAFPGNKMLPGAY
jgi:phosphate-selective porin OprO and OprP